MSEAPDLFSDKAFLGTPIEKQIINSTRHSALLLHRSNKGVEAGEGSDFY